MSARFVVFPIVVALGAAGFAMPARATAHLAHLAPYAVMGTVTDNAGTPLADTEIAVIERDSTVRATRSDASGSFRLGDLVGATTTVRVRHVGYKVRTIDVRAPDAAATVAVVSLFVKLDPAPVDLPTVLVNANGDEIAGSQLAEFYARAQRNHFGHFLDEKAMNELHPDFASEALRTIPGVSVRPSRRAGNIVKIRGCSPFIYVDGLRAAGAELDDVVQGSSVAAMEIYSSQAGVPPQYADRRATCGTILVWLKNR